MKGVGNNLKMSSAIAPGGATASMEVSCGWASAAASGALKASAHAKSQCVACLQQNTLSVTDQ
jgi:hypothetical protein